ncbi:MAG: hypothetical protein A2017_08480 [Lentisphaerae bacterium GWF2_44_16]|nr:MAG: hypothetical protein A2017_08480 [Lentisphaerae bacterium GWF2_44_16]
MKNQTVIYLLIAITASLYLLVQCCLPKDVFWTSDEGNKFIQTQNISSFNEIRINYPAEDIDPEYKYFPYCGHHFKKLDNGVYSFYPFYLPYISSFFYKAAGTAGIYFIPLISAIGIFILLFMLTKKLDIEKLFLCGLAAAAFCTPLFFYAFTFWEHTLSVFLCTAGILLLLRAQKKYILFAGILTGLSAVFREEAYIMFFSIACAYFICTRNKEKTSLYAAGWLFVMLPLWMIQKDIYGYFMGIHSAVYISMEGGGAPFIEFFLNKLSNFYVYIFRFSPGGVNPYMALITALPFALCCISGMAFRDFKSGLKTKSLFLSLSCAGGTFLTIFLYRSSNPVFDTLFTQSLIPSTPFILIAAVSAGAFLYSDKMPLKMLSIICLFFSVITCLLVNQKDIGIIWGPRHFLFLYPLLIPLCLYAAKETAAFFIDRRERVFFISVCIWLLMLSCAVQFCGIRDLFYKKDCSEKILASVNSLDSEVIVTDVFWLPEELSSIFFRKKILMVNPGKNLEGLVKLLKDRKVKSFALILSKNYRAIRNEDLIKSLDKVTVLSERAVSFPKAKFLGLNMLLCRIPE